ncbi:MAG: hypothetical protein NUV46_01780 [Nanoarchaeota archaeon]|nr:hypothetical protein [Nanoarchaeota archaeon]
MENLKKFSFHERRFFGFATAILVCFLFLSIMLINSSSNEPLELSYLILILLTVAFFVSLGVATGFFKYESKKYTKGIFPLLGCYAVTLMISYRYFSETQKETLLQIATAISILSTLIYFLKVRRDSNKKIELKEISFEELQKITAGKKLYWHGACSAESKEDFLMSLEEEHNFQNLDGNHYVFSESKEHYVENVEIVHGNCVVHTPLVKFNQGENYSFLVGDPYEISGTVEGIFYSGGNKYIVIKTSFNDFLLARVEEEEVCYMQIFE